MCHGQSFYSSYCKIDPPRSIYMANNGILEAVGVSDINICTTHNGQTKSSLIKGALHLPWLHKSLLSVAQLADAGVRTISDPSILILLIFIPVKPWIMPLGFTTYIDSRLR